MLEKVILAITGWEKETGRKEAEGLKRRLGAEGIAVERLAGEEGTEAGRDGEKDGPEDGGEDCGKGGRKDCGKYSGEDCRGTVYITDQPELVRRQAKEGCCMVLYLTQESRKLSFSGLPYAVETLEGLDGWELENIYRRHVGEPCRILETERLLVREEAETDLDALYQIYEDPSMTVYTEGPDADREKEREKLRAYIRTAYPLYGFGIWMLEERKTGKAVGRAGFFWRQQAKYPELGFAVRKQEQGRGYCLEACRAIIDYGFAGLEFKGIQAVTLSGNRAAEAVLMRLGFQRRGVQWAEGRKGTLWIRNRRGRCEPADPRTGRADRAKTDRQEATGPSQGG